MSLCFSFKPKPTLQEKDNLPYIAQTLLGIVPAKVQSPNRPRHVKPLKLPQGGLQDRPLQAKVRGGAQGVPPGKPGRIDRPGRTLLLGRFLVCRDENSGDPSHLDGTLNRNDRAVAKGSASG